MSHRIELVSHCGPLPTREVRPVISPLVVELADLLPLITAKRCDPVGKFDNLLLLYLRIDTATARLSFVCSCDLRLCTSRLLPSTRLLRRGRKRRQRAGSSSLTSRRLLIVENVADIFTPPPKRFFGVTSRRCSCWQGLIGSYACC